MSWVERKILCDEQQLSVVALRLVMCEKELCLPQSSVNGLMIPYSEPIPIFIYKMDLKVNWYTDRLRQAAALWPTCPYSSVSAEHVYLQPLETLVQMLAAVW